MTDIKKLQYDLAMHAAMAKTVVECQKDNQATPQGRFLANFRTIYKSYSEEIFGQQIEEIAAMLDKSE